MKFDHVALVSQDIDASIKWYSNRFECEVIYQDDTWGLVNVAGLSLAFVTPGQHPAHIAFCITKKESKMFPSKKFKSHRDGTKSFYERDNQNNIIEFIVRPSVEEN